ADPEKYLRHPGLSPMAAPLVQLGISPGTPAGGARTGSSAREDVRAYTYVCPMDPEGRSEKPGTCSKCGMALGPDTIAAPENKLEYVCPMHPEIVRDRPGHCPICGMALEPKTVLVEEENPELRGMSRRFWWSLPLATLALAIAMGEMFGGVAMGALSRWGIWL